MATQRGKHARGKEAQKIDGDDRDLPSFPETINNVTVSAGRDALLACVVDNLNGYKVAWVRVDTQTILSIHHNVISQNNRISLSYNDHRSWFLHIREVEETDRGWYMCQVNTDPMRSQKGYLQVVVPPVIVESMTSNDLVVREGLNVTLVCKARGFPDPYVMWRREDGEEMLIGGEQVNVVDGEMLHITKVSRLHMAAYLCVASNGVPPSISKRVQLRVQFPPMLSIPNQLEGAYLGQDVVLECHTEAYPASINYWTTERGDMIISDTSRAGDKYETSSTINGYTKYMRLKISSVGPNDFGTYRCVAKNSLGETDGNIKLDEMPTPTTAIITETFGWNRSLVGKHRHRNKFDLNALPDYGVGEWRDGVGNDADTDSVSDNNQTPMRNPPGAFHNSANSLAQHNLLGCIFLWIKKQSFGIYKHLSSWYQPQRQHRKEKHQNEKKESASQQLQQTKQYRGEVNQKIQNIQYSRQQQQQQNKWQTLKRQRKNHVFSLQRFATAYEQPTFAMVKEKAKTLLSKAYAAAYTQRNFQLLPQFLIRRIRALKMIASIFDSKVKIVQAQANDLHSPEAKAAVEPTQSQISLTLRLFMLTAPPSRAISMEILTTIKRTRAKVIKLDANLQNAIKVVVNYNENFTNAMKNILHQRRAVDDRLAANFVFKDFLSVDRRLTFHFVDNICSEVSEREESIGCVSEELLYIYKKIQSSDCLTGGENNNNTKCESSSYNRPKRTIYKTIYSDNNKQNPKGNNNKKDLQLFKKIQTLTMMFLIFPFMLFVIEMMSDSNFCILLLGAYLLVHKQKTIADSITRLWVWTLISSRQNKWNGSECKTSKPVAASEMAMPKKHEAITTTRKTTTLLLSHQRLRNAVRFTSKSTKRTTFTCWRQYFPPILQRSPSQTLIISSHKRATTTCSKTIETTTCSKTSKLIPTPIAMNIVEYFAATLR